MQKLVSSVKITRKVTSTGIRANSSKNIITIMLLQEADSILGAAAHFQDKQ